MFVCGQSTVARCKRSGTALATSAGRGRDYTSKVNVQHCCRCSCCCRCRCCCCYCCCIWRKSFLATLLLQSLGVEWGTVPRPPAPSLPLSCFLPQLFVRSYFVWIEEICFGVLAAHLHWRRQFGNRRLSSSLPAARTTLNWRVSSSPAPNPIPSRHHDKNR